MQISYNFRENLSKLKENCRKYKYNLGNFEILNKSQYGFPEF